MAKYKSVKSYQLEDFRKIGSFLEQKRAVVYFLILLALLSVISIMFGSPDTFTRYIQHNTLISPLSLMAIAIATGYLTIALSKLLFLRLSNRNKISNSGEIIWLIAELTISVAAIALTLWLVSGRGELLLAPLVGNILLFIIILEAIPFTISYLVHRLHEEHAMVEELTNRLANREPLNNSKKSEIVNFYDKGNRLSFAVQCGNILFIEAADNYANIHYLKNGKSESFILHNSMKEIEQRYEDHGLIRCHRGYMVNAMNVKLIRKEAGMLQLEIDQVDRPIPVSKTYEERILKVFSSQ